MIYNCERKGVLLLAFDYNPLWVLLVKKRMKKTELAEKIGISKSTLAKMGKNEYVAMEVLDRICNYLSCQMSDIVEHIQDQSE